MEEKEVFGLWIWMDLIKLKPNLKGVFRKAKE